MKKREKTTATDSTSGQKQSTTSSRSTSESEDRFLQVFSKHQPIWLLFKNSQELVNFSHDKQAELLIAYRMLVDPYYHYNMACPVCVQEFITRCYTWYENR